jgi:hypothetical protein
MSLRRATEAGRGASSAVGMGAAVGSTSLSAPPTRRAERPFGGVLSEDAERELEEALEHAVTHDFRVSPTESLANTVKQGSRSASRSASRSGSVSTASADKVVEPVVRSFGRGEFFSVCLMVDGVGADLGAGGAGNHSKKLKDKDKDKEKEKDKDGKTVGFRGLKGIM